MPAAISTKLSPLTILQTDFYTKTISQKNFKADTKFCSLAKLACSSPLDQSLISAANEATTSTKPNAKVYGATTSTKPNAKVYGATTSTKPNAKVYAATTSTKPNAKVYGATTSTKPNAKVYAATTSTNPNAKVYGATTSTKPNEKVYGATTSTKPNAKVYAATTSTKPNAKVYGATTSTKPNAKVYAATTSTNPNAKVYGATTSTNPNAKVYEATTTTSLINIDPFTFFRPSYLKEGDTIHLSSLKESIPHRTFLPPQIASKLSLTLKGVTNLFPYSSKDSIETTLSYCSAAAIKGEFKPCPKSLEEMISSAKTALGATKLLALTTKNTEGSDKSLMIKKVKQFNVEKIVACHEIFLPFATYFCHSLPSSRIYALDLVEPEARTPVNTAVAVCHMDTSSWPASHVAFKILKFGPGQGEACHWMNEIDLAWIGDGNI